MIEDAADPAARSAEHQELRQRFDDLLAEQKELIVDNEFDQIYTKAGGTGMNAGTSTDWTIYFINMPANKLELWAWMESDRLMNPVFRLPSEELEKTFIAEAAQAGMVGIKGHRSVGGIRTSIYNAMEPADVQRFADLARSFAKG